MLKMALFDCAINEKCCNVDGGRGICPPFSSPTRGIWQLKSSHPREFPIQGQKNANVRGSARGGPGRRWNWLIHKGINWKNCGRRSSWSAVNVGSLEKRSNQLKYQEQKKREVQRLLFGNVDVPFQANKNYIRRCVIRVECHDETSFFRWLDSFKAESL